MKINRLILSILFIHLLIPNSFAQVVNGGVMSPRVLRLASFRTFGSYNWTVPNNVTVIYPYGCAAGGGGGGGQNALFGAGGGGGGAGKCIPPFLIALPVTPGETISIGIGQGGQGGVLGVAGTAGADVNISGAHSYPDGIDSQFPTLQAGLGGAPGVGGVGGAGGNGGGTYYYGGGGGSTGNGGLVYAYGQVYSGAGGGGGGSNAAAQGIGGGNPIYESSSTGTIAVGGGGAGAASMLGYGASPVGPNQSGVSPPAGGCGAGASGGGWFGAGGNGSDGCLFILY